MKLIPVLFLFLLTNSEPVKKLSDFQWENRLLLIFDHPSDLFQKIPREELNDRKLLYFQFKGTRLIHSNFEGMVDVNSFQILKENRSLGYFLIGLDGSIKASGSINELSVPALIKIIDSMPMRQSEIRRKNWD